MLSEKLLAERPGILNWGLGGLTRLLKQKQFTESEAVKEYVTVYQGNANPVARWLAEEGSKLREKTARDAHRHFCEWCNAQGYAALSLNVFGKRVKELGVASRRRSSGTLYDFSSIVSHT
jgi:putative DNA primase/helicase